MEVLVATIQEKINELAHKLKVGLSLAEMSEFIKEVYRLGEGHGEIRAAVYDRHGVLHHGTAPIESLRRTSDEFGKGLGKILFP